MAFLEFAAFDGAERLANAVLREIQQLDTEIPVSAVMSMNEVLRLAHWPHRVFGSIFAMFGLVAVALAGLGLYSVLA